MKKQITWQCSKCGRFVKVEHSYGGYPPGDDYTWDVYYTCKKCGKRHDWG